MSASDQLTAAQLREAAQALGEWIADQQHHAEIGAEVLDRDGALACRDRADRVRAVREVLEAEAARREAQPDSG